MPFLDVSEILFDPVLAQSVTVYRRTETINTYGESVVTPVPHTGVIGVITSASPNDLQRLDDNQRMGRNMCFVTNFRLQGPSPGKQADLVLWAGDLFVVKWLDPYPLYGAGFVQCIIGSIDHVDLPVP